jgi:hypothetical protein
LAPIYGKLIWQASLGCVNIAPTPAGSFGIRAFSGTNHGKASATYFYPPVSHEPRIAQLKDDVAKLRAI